MDNPKNQLVDKLKTANYVLVTVSHDPSIDQLAALLGLTLALNKADKHAAAVFSGQVPSTLEFLKPEDTIEKTTDSLRDFIIALDKSKADKLRYKVEDDVVRIFITPYKTSITQADLEFSQGDFNVDVVVALGVTRQEDLDEAIVTHGRILHDATVATINISSEGDLGSIHWQDNQASSLSEMVTELTQMLGENLVDNQIATALLTGIVAETERFSNEKTTAKVMSASAVLMAAGANQQLVASELAQPQTSSAAADDSSSDSEQVAELELPDVPELATQELDINHDTEDTPPASLPEPQAEGEYFSLPDQPEETPEPETPTDPPVIDTAPAPEAPASEHLSSGSRLITEPPTLGGQLTANSQTEVLEPSSDPMSMPSNAGQDTLLTRGEPVANTPVLETPAGPEPAFTPPAAPEPQPEPVAQAEPPVPPAAPSEVPTGFTPPPPSWVPPQDSPLDTPVTSTPDVPAEQIPATPEAGLDAARDEVMKALNSDSSQPLEPVQALNAQPMVDGLNTSEATPAAPTPEPTVVTPAEPLNELPSAIPSLPLPSTPATPDTAAVPSAPFDPASFGIDSQPGAAMPGTATPQVIDPNAAPPVPPPIPFNFGAPPTPPQQ